MTVRLAKAQRPMTTSVWATLQGLLLTCSLRADSLAVTRKGRERATEPAKLAGRMGRLRRPFAFSRGPTSEPAPGSLLAGY